MNRNRCVYPVLIGLVLSFGGSLAACALEEPHAEADEQWIALLDKDLSQWNIFMGVPHTSVDLPGYPKGDGKQGTPIGLNKDPLRVFTVEGSEGAPVLRISGEVYAGLSTKEEFENYHLKMEFKWGEKKYEPRLDKKRNSGLHYHAQEPYGHFWNAWMRAPEMQIQEGDIGDFHPLGGVSMDIRASLTKEDGVDRWIYDPTAESRVFRTNYEPSSVRRSHNYEKPSGEWNSVEVICLENESLHIVNGHVVMVLENSKLWLDEGTSQPLTRGKIEIQSEGSEMFYRNITIREIVTIPDEYLKQIARR